MMRSRKFGENAFEATDFCENYALRTLKGC
jgi:hypothetical protein